MKIEADKVVSIDYTLKEDQDQVLDSSEENGPLSFMYGNGNIITGLETALEGKTVAQLCQKDKKTGSFRLF